jgi:hypothetical protein
VIASTHNDAVDVLLHLRGPSPNRAASKVRFRLPPRFA